MLALLRLRIELLLALGQLLELLQGIVDFLLPLVGSLRFLGAFVLVLLGIQFEVEKALQVACSAAATTAPAATAALSELNLDIAHGGFGAQ